jgi:hypothetical protein
MPINSFYSKGQILSLVIAIGSEGIIAKMLYLVHLIPKIPCLF